MGGFTEEVALRKLCPKEELKFVRWRLRKDIPGTKRKKCKNMQVRQHHGMTAKIILCDQRE